jgi:dienelactone hydrolase
MFDSTLQRELTEFLRLEPPVPRANATIVARITRDGYDEVRIEYASERIPAYLLIPSGTRPRRAVVAHHQHAGQRHWGKSEVVGLVGNPLQAFGPALARRGVVVLAPDSICFEDRRTNQRGTEPAEGEADWLQHYNALAYRLVVGDTLIRKVLSDSMLAVSVLAGLPEARGLEIGMFGHSYGGNTVLFHAAIDPRIRFACSSGAACSYRRKLATGTGIEMAEVIPGFAARWDVEHLVRAIAPRHLLIVSGADDPYSADADEIELLARPAYENGGHSEALTHLRDQGGHAMTPERFAFIVDWLAR